MKNLTKKERTARVIARGEVSGHSHVIVGDAEIERTTDGKIIVQVGNEGAVLKHLLESEWMQGNEVWTKEHTDIPLEKGRYEFVQQTEYNPYNDKIQQVRD